MEGKRAKKKDRDRWVFIIKTFLHHFLLNGKTEEKAPLLWSERESNETSAGIEERKNLECTLHILTQSYNKQQA